MGLNVGTLTVQLTGQDAKFRSMMGRASGALTRLRGQLLGVSLAASAAFAPLATVGKMTATAAGDFERGMARTAAVAQITSSKVEKALSRTVLGLAAKTEFTARQVADASGNLAQLGFNAQEIMGALPSALELASAGMMDVAEASAIAAKIMRSQGFATSDLARVNDVLVSSFTGAAIDVQGLGEAFKYVGSVGKSAGVEFEELSASLGMLGNVGVSADVAGTGLRKIIAGLIAPTGKASKLIDELGLGALMAATDGFPKLADIVEVLEKQIKSGASEMDIMGKVVLAFGQRAGPTLQNLVNVGSDSLRKFTQRLRESGGTAQSIAQRQLNTFDGRMKILASQVEGLSIAVGNMLIPYIDRLAGAVSGMVGWFQRLPASVKASVVEFGVLATGALGALAAISGLTLILSPLVSALGIVGKAMFAAFSKPLLVAGALIGGLVLAIGALRKAWDANLFGMQDSLTDLMESMGKLIDRFESVMKADEKVFASFRENTGVSVSVVDGQYFLQKERDVGPAGGMTAEQHQQYLANNVASVLMALPEDMARSMGDAVRDLVMNDRVGSSVSFGSRGMAIYSAGPGEQARPVPAGGGGARDIAASAIADVTDTFKTGVQTILEGLGVAGGLVADQIDPSTLGDLQSKVDGVIAGMRDFVDALKQGGIDTTIAVRTGAEMLTQSLDAMLFPGLVRIRREVDAAAKKLGELGKAGATAVITLAEMGSTVRKLSIVPSVVKDDNGASTFDAGSMLGGSEVGGVLQAAGQGAVVGGPFGAIIGALAAILTGAEKFQTALEYGGETLGVLGDALAEFEGPMEAVHGQMRMLTESIAKPLAGVMQSFGEILQVLAPIFALLTLLMAAIAPIVEVFADVLTIIADGLMFIIQAFMVVLRPIILAILYWVRAIVAVWNGVIGAFKWVFDKLSDIPLIGEVFKPLSRAFGQLMVSTDGLDSAIGTLRDSIVDDPFASDFVSDSISNGADKFNEGADAAQRAGGALSNVPEGYKVALRRFQAMNPIDPETWSQGGAGDLSRAARYGARDGRSAGDDVIAGLGGVSDASSDAATALAGLAGAASDAVGGVFDMVAEVLSRVTGGGSSGGGGGGSDTGLGNVHAFAKGGIVTGPTYGVFGEAGTEAVIPLDRLHEFMGGGGRGSSINIEHLTVEANDPDEMLRKIEARASRQSYLRNGQSEPGAPRYTGRR